MASAGPDRRMLVGGGAVVVMALVAWGLAAGSRSGTDGYSSSAAAAPLYREEAPALRGESAPQGWGATPPTQGVLDSAGDGGTTQRDSAVGVEPQTAAQRRDGGTLRSSAWDDEAQPARGPERRYDFEGTISRMPASGLTPWTKQPDEEDAACAVIDMTDSMSEELIPAAPSRRSCAYGRPQKDAQFARFKGGRIEFEETRCPYGRAWARDDFGTVEFQPLGEGSAVEFDGEFAYARCRALGLVNLLSRFVPRPEAEQRALQATARGASRPNVLVLHVRGLSRAHAFRALPRTVALLRAASEATQGGFEAFHLRRAHAVSALPSENQASLLAGRVSFSSLDKEEGRWLWQEAREAGYVTSVGNDGCDREAPTFTQDSDHGGLSQLACSALQQELGVQTAAEGDPEVLCVGGRPLHEHGLDYALEVLTSPAYGDAPRLVVQSLYGAAEATMSRAFSLDEALRATLERVAAQAPDTAVVLAADSGNTQGDFYFGTQAGRSEAALPAAFLMLPGRVLDAHPGARDALRANEDVLVTPASLHSTLREIMGLGPRPGGAGGGGGAGEEGGDAAPSLLQALPRERTCADAGVQPAVCQCGEWADTDRDGRALAEFVLSEVNAKVWRPGYFKQDARRACQPFRLAEVYEAVRLSFPAQEAASAAVPMHPTAERFRIKLRTRGGRGYKGQRFEAEVVDYRWRFERERDRHRHVHNVYDAPIVRRLTPTERYARCLSEADGEATPLEFCVCDVAHVGGDEEEVEAAGRTVDDVLDAALRPTRREEVAEEVDDESAPMAAVRVPMVQKDEVEMLRWSHNGVETFEVNNMKNADIMFKISMQIGVNGVLNVRSSHSMPVWRHVPAFATRALTVLDRAKKDEPWTWNFDWRWDVVEAHQRHEPVRYVGGRRFKSLDVFYKMREGVALTKIYDLFPRKGKRRSLHYQVLNMRNEPVEYELEVFMSGARRVRAPSGSHRRVRIEPGQQKLVVHIEATTGHPEKAREALQRLKHVGSWSSLGSYGANL